MRAHQQEKESKQFAPYLQRSSITTLGTEVSVQQSVQRCDTDQLVFESYPRNEHTHGRSLDNIDVRLVVAILGA